ncbi:hypothetical protein L209DRAFT_500996 [Thermothelomyces heterothallicus CBS 203.75]
MIPHHTHLTASFSSLFPGSFIWLLHVRERQRWRCYDNFAPARGSMIIIGNMIINRASMKGSFEGQINTHWVCLEDTVYASYAGRRVLCGY